MQEEKEKFDDAAQGKVKPAAPVPMEVKKETKAKGGGAWWS